MFVEEAKKIEQEFVELKEVGLVVELVGMGEVGLAVELVVLAREMVVLKMKKTSLYIQ